MSTAGKFKDITYNLYKTVDPDIILISEHGNLDEQQIKVFGYDVIQKNPSRERFDGAAIVIKRNLKSQKLYLYVSNSCSPSTKKTERDTCLTRPITTQVDVGIKIFSR